MSNGTHPILEIRMYRVRGEHRDDHLQRTRARQAALRELPGVQLVSVLPSIFSFPKKDAEGAHMELIQWASKDAADASREAAAEGFSHALLLHGRFDTEDAKGADVAAVLESGQALEFGGRRIKPDKDGIFMERRADFMAKIKENDGVAFDFELRSIDDDLSMVFFGWNSVDFFEAAKRRAFLSPRIWWQMARYFPLAEKAAFQVGVVP
jgi:heme-degrading monooxygenase HmoA